MTLPNKIDIDILEFLRTGKFDYLKPGQTKEWIINNFPDPDYIGIGDSFQNAKIWFYGNIELHFDKQELSLIFLENLVDLYGGQSIELKKWILSEPTKLTLSNVIDELNIERIDFSKKTERFDVEYVRLHLSESKVQLTFIDQDNKINNPNKFELSSLSLTRQ